MRIGIYHGYELTGSGSNEYTRYLARSLGEVGHQVHVICREAHPDKLPFVTRAFAWDEKGKKKNLTLPAPFIKSHLETHFPFM